MIQGEDLRPWYQEDEGRWLIFTRRGIEIDAYPSIKSHLLMFRDRLDPKRLDWDDQKDGEWNGRKTGTYKWYEIQDSIDYYDAFEKSKIFWPDISKLPRFSYGDPGVYIGNTGYIMPDAPPSLLGILQSRVIWFAISQICQPLRLRAGLWQYRLLPQFVNRLPIPDLSPQDNDAIGGLARQLNDLARDRYAFHQRVRHRLQADLGTPDARLNQKLTAWWEQDFPALRAEVKKVFQRDVPLSERDEWDRWHAANRADHDRLTAEIVRLETELNARVYAVFNLTAEEILLVEESTKYRYGEV
jgi:hypothetical protein